MQPLPSALGSPPTVSPPLSRLSVAAPGGTTPRREGFTAATLLPPLLAATRCRVGLQTSRMGVGAMLNPGIPRPLTKIAGKPHSKKDSTSKNRRSNKRKHTGWRAARPGRQTPTTTDLQGEEHSQAATRAPSLRTGSEPSRPAPARPTGRYDLWLESPRMEQRAGRHPTASRVSTGRQSAPQTARTALLRPR